MASNRYKSADIKSESWLDLTKEQPIERPKWLLKKMKQKTKSLIDEDEEQVDEDEDNYKIPQTNSDNDNDLIGIGGPTVDVIVKQPELSEAASTCSLSQDHLLIRIRQESYRLSRRSSLTSSLELKSATTSNANSHEFVSETNLIAANFSSKSSTTYHGDKLKVTSNDMNQRELTNCWSDSQNHQMISSTKKTSSHISINQQKQQVSISSRLLRFKRKLESRAHKQIQLINNNDKELEQQQLRKLISSTTTTTSFNDDNENNNEKINLVRSFSNLGDKFCHLRRSWSKFLSSSSNNLNNNHMQQSFANQNYHRNQKELHSQSVDRENVSFFQKNHNTRGPNQSGQLWPIEPPDASDPIGKWKLTERWLSNHHLSNPNQRPRSLQVEPNGEFRPPIGGYPFSRLSTSNGVVAERDSSSSTTLVEPLQQQETGRIFSEIENFECVNRLNDATSIGSNRQLQLQSNHITSEVKSEAKFYRSRAVSLEPSHLLANKTGGVFGVGIPNQRERRRGFSQRPESSDLKVQHQAGHLGLVIPSQINTTTDTDEASTSSRTSSSCSYNRNITTKKFNLKMLQNNKNQQVQLSAMEAQHYQHQMMNQNHKVNSDPRANLHVDEYYFEAANEEEGEEHELLTQNNQLHPFGSQLQHLTTGPMQLQYNNLNNSMLNHHHQLQSTANHHRDHSVEAQLSAGSSSLDRNPSLQGGTMASSQFDTNFTNNISTLHGIGVGGFNSSLIHADAYEFNADDYDDYAIPSDENFCRLDRSQVELVQMIGEGQKGFVFLGKLQSRDGRQIIDVAIKTLKYETESLIEKLMHEAAMMRQFEHPHIIRFIGVCPETPALIAMELAKFGELRHYLRSNQSLVSVSQLVLFTFQISTALSYLESKAYVHRDVAARNVLVCSHTCVKLADFGLTRNLQPEPPGCQSVASARNNHGNANNGGRSSLSMNHLAVRAAGSRLLLEPDDKCGHYVAVTAAKLPVRWLAPESLAFRRFTSASDVWMFAVCSWEIFHLGQLRPWPHITNSQVLATIGSGQRLSRPPACPARLYQLLLQCWSYAPIRRPKFRDIKQSLWSIYLSERTREQILLEEAERGKVKRHEEMLAMAARQHAQAEHEQQQRIWRHQLKQQEMMISHRQDQIEASRACFNLATQQQIAANRQLCDSSPKSASSPVSSSGGSSLARARQQRSATKLADKKINHHHKSSSSSGLIPSIEPPMSSNEPQALSPHVTHKGRASKHHRLQKQRSHGSIIQANREYAAHQLTSGKPDQSSSSSNNSRNPFITSFSCHQDDLYLTAANQRLHQSASSSERLIHYPAWTRHHILTDLKHQQEDELEDEELVTANHHQNDPPHAQAQTQTQGAYEGLCCDQSMMSPPVDHQQQPRTMSNQQLNSQLKLDAPSGSVCNLSYALGAMRLHHQANPMRAQLDQVRESTSLDGHLKGAEAEETARLRREQDQQNRLALHRRLLGHIRPASSASSNRKRDRPNRNSLNLSSIKEQMMNANATSDNNDLIAPKHLATNAPDTNINSSQQTHSSPSSKKNHNMTRVESVDQSLEILASLISPTNDKDKDKDKQPTSSSTNSTIKMNSLTSPSSPDLGSPSSPVSPTRRPKSRESQLQLQWRKISQEFEKSRKVKAPNPK